VSAGPNGGRVSRWLLGTVLALGGCAWHTPQTSLVPRSDFARAILHVYGIITWAVSGIAAVVLIALVLIFLRFRGREGAPLPRQVRGHTLLEISWTIAPALVLLVIAIPTIQVIFRTQSQVADALEIVVGARQWWWEFTYPSLGLVTANELHVPTERAVSLRLEGPDVIHSFWVPQLGGKRDVVPGRINRLTFVADTPGEYLGQCAEFCGTSHANMRVRVFVDTPAAFARWVAGQRAPAAEVPGAAAGGKAVYARSACVGCHTIQGVSTGVVGPNLTHVGSRTTIAAGLLPNDRAQLVAWIRDPPALKPGAKMPALGLSEADATAIADYLVSLK
jgi:cytochrome c oxidase subunit II